MRTYLSAAAVAFTLSAALASNSALATIVVDPGAVGLAGATKTIDRFSQTYGADVKQSITGGFNVTFPSNDTFLETGGFVVNQYQLGGVNVVGTGLNNFPTGYQVYGTFTATGASTFNAGAGTITSNFTSFNVQLFIDPAFDTVINTATGGTIGGNLGNDFQIATGTLNAGGVNQSNTNLNGLQGDFEVLVDFTATSLYFQGSPFTMLLQLDGTVNVVQGPGPGFPGDGVYSIRVQGDGRGTFEVPAPASLGLLGAALTGLGLIRRRRSA